MPRPAHPIRILLALFLILALAMILTGCIYIPLWGYAKTPDGVAASQQLGPADSHKPLRIAKATREQVRAIFGKPDLISPNGRSIGYTKLSAPNWLIIGICGGFYDRGYYLFLEFDDKDLLRRYRLIGGYNHEDRMFGPLLPTSDEVDSDTAWQNFLLEGDFPTSAPR